MSGLATAPRWQQRSAHDGEAAQGGRERWQYLVDSVSGEVAQGAEAARYYAGQGTPLGKFLGRGLVGLGSHRGAVNAGDVVSPEMLYEMLVLLPDPLTGLGCRRHARRNRAVGRRRSRPRKDEEPAGGRRTSCLRADARHRGCSSPRDYRRVDWRSDRQPCGLRSARRVVSHAFRGDVSVRAASVGSASASSEGK
jgi:hypothetical protein